MSHPFYLFSEREDGSDCGGLRLLCSLRPLPQSTSSRYRGTRILRSPPPARVRGWTRLHNHCHPPSRGYKKVSQRANLGAGGCILSEKASLFKFLQTLSTVTPLPECSERGRCAQFNNFVELSTVAKCRGGWKGGRCAQ